MSTLKNQICARCGAQLAAFVTEGVCSACLLEQGLAPGIPDVTLPLSRFGDYELIEEIARGGMGVVYKARQVSLGRIVAVKMILSGQFASPAEMQRFRAEARATAALQHPGIVAIHEVGEHDGLLYFSMDFIEGRDLAELIRNGPWPARRAAQCVCDLAQAIHYAHEQGVLHRDLKPSNVLIDSEGKPRVTDFGLAKRLTDSNPEAQGTELTVSGQVLGSPSFMPPEQAAGKHRGLTPASDVYSLGALLYHVLTGRPPFLADNIPATLRLVVETEPVAPRLLAPNVPCDLETICLKCLAKDPRRRYATAQDLAAELGRFLRDEPILARPLGKIARLWGWCCRKPGLAGLSTTIGLLLLAVVVALSLTAFRIYQLNHRVDEARKDFLRSKDIPDRDPRCPPESIDLSDYYNAGLTENWHFVKELVTSSGYAAENNLSQLPRGVQKFAGIEFDVRGLIQLASHNTRARDSGSFPEQVRQIKVSRPCRKLHFLHAAIESNGAKDGKRVGSYIVHFRKHPKKEIPLLYGESLRDWWILKDEPREAKNATIAWLGTNSLSGIRLFKSTWENPLPHVKIESIDFISGMSGPAPFLIAITLE
jgi:tRNA A-37 threonylcarbamoyl transferase component Bud32